MSTTFEEKEMSFLDHLEELRWHLIRSIIAIICIGIVAFVMKDFVFDTIIFGPKKMSFPTYRFFCNIGQFIGIESEFCADSLPFTIQNRTMAGQFSAHIWTSIWAGFILGFPYLLFELWRFISPGLYENERKYSKGFIFVASFLFFMGVLFGYYIVSPLSINFLGTYTVSQEVSNEIDISSFISTVRASVIACGIMFELPNLLSDQNWFSYARNIEKVSKNCNCTGLIAICCNYPTRCSQSNHRCYSCGISLPNKHLYFKNCIEKRKTK